MRRVMISRGMALTLEQLRERLGPPAEFTLTQRNSQYLRQWALGIGLEPARVFGMSNIDLTNLYHERGDEENSETSELRKIAADIFLRLHQTMMATKIDPDWMRSIIVEEIRQLPPQRIEIVTPNAPSVILDGPQHKMTETIIRISALNHPIMLVGPAGCGKTTIGRQTATAFNLPFYITSTINEPHELTGFIDGYGKYHRMPFRDAFEFGGIWVADEIDAWDASALLAANAALANGFAVFPDNPAPIYRHPMFRVIATANTFGHGADRIYIGRNELDAASLDRFAVIPIEYDLDLERMYANGNTKWLNRVWEIRKAIEENKIRHVVSSRAILMGGAALAAGISRDDVEEFYLFKGMNKRDRNRLED